jgi:hypothetical protein
MAEPTTLDELLTRAPMDLDMEVTVAAFNEQRIRWLSNQAIGSRKLVKSKSIPVGMEIDLSAMKPTKITL